METENNWIPCEQCSEYCLKIIEHVRLCLGASSGHCHSLKWLIKAGADVNRPDSLIKAGADVNIVDELGNPPLMLAARRGHTKCVELLIQAGANVNYRNKTNSTSLINAAFCTVELLIKSGADVNAADNSGMTAFMKAAEDMDVLGTGCVKLLLQSRALINMFDVLNYNALQNHIRCYSLSYYNRPIRDMCLFLFAAGETIDETHLYVWGHELPIPDYLLFEDLKFSLKHLCRMAIRNHLLFLDPHTHLFGRVPRIGLPASLSEYLLFGESLEPDARVVTGKLIREHGHLNYEYDGNDNDAAKS